jgi:GNAT superfamily N-acetyltransferase
MSSMGPPLKVRRATVGDLDGMLATLQAGFDSYLSFAALGWSPPDVSANRRPSADVLADPSTWALIALDQAEPVGHVIFTPARQWSSEGRRLRRDARARIPGMAHLSQLFVVPDWWGRGVAPMLHDAAIEEMRAQRFARARLYTPALHARARRFYERRGWSLRSEQWDEDLAMMIVEYGLPL